MSPLLTRRPRSWRGIAPVMPPFKGKLKDVEIHGVVEFIKSLK